MKFNVLNYENNIVSDIDISDDIFAIEPRKDIISRVVLWQLAKRRSGNHLVKGKSTVHGTTKKMYKQKGTGGARHGSKKAVQFRGGGIVFGPVVRDHSFSLQKKVRKLGLKMSLSSKVKDGSLILIDSLSNDQILKTKECYDRYKKFGNSILFVGVDKNENFEKSISNIVGYDYIAQIGLNVYDILQKDKIILSVDSLKALEDRLS